jgi:hypothetical protein
MLPPHWLQRSRRLARWSLRRIKWQRDAGSDPPAPNGPASGDRREFTPPVDGRADLPLTVLPRTNSRHALSGGRPLTTFAIGNAGIDQNQGSSHSPPPW